MSREVLREAARAAAAGRRAVLCTIVETRGSTPAGVGARMLVREDGTFAGTVGGGCLEHDVWGAARRVLEEGGARLVSVDLTDYEALEAGLACGGSLRILLERADGRTADAIRRGLERAERGEPAVLATVLPEAPSGPGPGGTTLAEADGTPVGEAARRAAEDGLARTVPLPGGGRAFLDPLVRPEVAILGAGHVGLAIARAVAPLGFAVTVADDREAFVNGTRFPDARRILAPFSEALAHFPVGPATAILVVTRGHRHDETALERAVATTARYVGLIGSARKILGIFRRLLAKGVPAEALARVVAPIGVGAGAETPEEIAAAVAAELVAFRRLGPEAALRLNPKAAAVRERFLASLAPRRSQEPASR
ncbi:MAG: XdhC/CoxI family protein [Planctomycetales bacterium]|nr:XdhC/CoxI family protein [Planctomycetales bacterium]